MGQNRRLLRMICFFFFSFSSSFFLKRTKKMLCHHVVPGIFLRTKSTDRKWVVILVQVFIHSSDLPQLVQLTSYILLFSQMLFWTDTTPTIRFYFHNFWILCNFYYDIIIETLFLIFFLLFVLLFCYCTAWLLI